MLLLLVHRLWTSPLLYDAIPLKVLYVSGYLP